MKQPVRWLLAVLAFPVAPIAVIYVIHKVCYELWLMSYYMPGKDGGEVEPAVAGYLIPLLLVAIACMLGTLTFISRWLSLRGYAFAWLCGLFACLRISLTLLALAMFVVAAAFFMGTRTTALTHWQMILAWILVVASGGALVLQQARRILH